ncbi:4-alpha-glucanotransferase [Bacteroidia bacterium]|nr:4-alpha-glucanotransferase [Bacteroidia bacterium]
MKLRFQLQYHTNWGQIIYITGCLPELGEWNVNSAKPMLYTGDGNWSLEIDLPNQPLSVEYRYLLFSDGHFSFEDWPKNHKQDITDADRDYTFADNWQFIPPNLSAYSSAFKKIERAGSNRKAAQIAGFDRKICLRVLTPDVKSNQSLALVGNQSVLGAWDISKALVLNGENFPEWSIELDADVLSFPLEYKFCILDNEDKPFVLWEEGENRILNIPPLKNRETLVFSGLHFRNDWQQWKCAGMVIPVFSLRSEESFGIGDFADLKKITDWLHLTSQKILQVLPLNDTTQTHTWLDSYPYNAISIYALHPIYLNLDLMGKLNNPERAAFFRKKQKKLNALPELDYELTDQFKWEFFREIFAQEGKNTLLSPEFLKFFTENKEWLVPYSAYSYLRDMYKTSDFRLWKEYQTYNKGAIERFCQVNQPHYSGIAIYYYLQFHLSRQLSVAREYANSKGVALKGDIPIGISRTSVEAWTDSEYFNLDYQTGAPPDDFSITGQNWHFPTYHWENMEADNYKWWEKRFRKMSDYFDAYRIDHILGFFRIWEIAGDSVQGLLGRFNPALPVNFDEIRSWKFHAPIESFTQSRINARFLPEIFGDYTHKVSQVFLNRISSDYFALKSRFNTQRKIQAFFSDKEDTESITIREGLYRICNEVLFIRDKEKQDCFHPRITASSTFAYRELSESDKMAFNNLYNHYFYHRHNAFWQESGEKKLSRLVFLTDMLTCGEDLGMIPECVPQVMQKLKILSLEIERMPKESHVEFTGLQRSPYLSVCTTSTHDMSTLRMWWKENREKTQQYYNEVLKREGIAPENCEPEICEQIIANHLNATSMLTIIPLQDWLSIDSRVRQKDENAERINVPSNSRHYWKYRMHLTVEELLNADELNTKIRNLIVTSGR